MNYPEDFHNKIIEGDCLEIMPEIPDGSIDMILCDLPYGITACKWDRVIDLEKLWEQYKRIVKPHTPIVLFSSQPFTTDLINSNRKWLRDHLIWDKKQSGNPFMAKVGHLKIFEEIVIFGKKKIIYNPLLVKRGKIRKKGGCRVFNEIVNQVPNNYTQYNDIYYPTAILEYSVGGLKTNSLHPTQKPVALCKYLIKTYSNPGDVVLDNCLGSGTTAIACLDLDRKFIGIELEPKYVKLARDRIANHKVQPELFTPTPDPRPPTPEFEPLTLNI